MAQQSQTNVVELTNVLDQDKIKLDADIQRAEQAEKHQLRMLEDRKAMPKGLAVGMTRVQDAFLEHQKRYLPESLTPWERESRPPTDEERRKGKGTFMPGAKLRCFWDVAEHHKANCSKGWTPVKDEDGHQVMVGSCLMYKRAMELTRQAIRDTEAISTRRLMSTDEKMQMAAKSGGGEITEDKTEVVSGGKKLAVA